MSTFEKPSATALKPHQSALLIAGAVSLLLWVIPVFGFVLLPLQYLNTHLHEFCHAFMAMITGGDVDFIRVYASGNGVTLASGSPLLVSSAGYLGAIVIGAFMIWLGRSERGAALMMRILACVLVFSFVLWVRGDLIGIVSGAFWMVVLFAMPSFLKGRRRVLAAQFLGMQQCLASVQAIYALLQISAFGGHSDAKNMAEFTGIPAMAWAILWATAGLLTLVATLRASWTNHPRA